MSAHQFLFAANQLERALAKLDNRDFDDLPATGPAFFDAFSQAHYRRMANTLRTASGAECWRQENCPGHVASEDDPKICGICGTHVDSLRPDDEQRP